jgi:hypothetical protein
MKAAVRQRDFNSFPAFGKTCSSRSPIRKVSPTLESFQELPLKAQTVFKKYSNVCAYFSIIFSVGRIITWIQHVNFLLRMLQYKNMSGERFATSVGERTSRKHTREPFTLFVDIFVSSTRFKGGKRGKRQRRCIERRAAKREQRTLIHYLSLETH